MTEAKRYACMPGDRFEYVRTDSERCRLTTICYIALDQWLSGCLQSIMWRLTSGSDLVGTFLVARACPLHLPRPEASQTTLNKSAKNEAAVSPFADRRGFSD